MNLEDRIAAIERHLFGHSYTDQAAEPVTEPADPTIPTVAEDADVPTGTAADASDSAPGSPAPADDIPRDDSGAPRYV